MRLISYTRLGANTLKAFMNLSKIGRVAFYLFNAPPYPLEKPTVLQFPVIDICNSQCQMCRIWENKKSDDIQPADLRRGLRSPLFSEVVGVGLNGGEPTLRRDLGQLTAILFEELPKLKTVSLITNAYRHDEVIARVGDVGEVARSHGGALDVMVSLDGYGAMHDLVRGKPGNFVRAEKVIEFLKESPLVGNVRIGCTVIKANIYGLADLFEYCQERNVYIKYRLGIPHQRLYTQNLLDPYALTADEKYHLAEFLEGLIHHYEESQHQRFFYRSLVDQLVHYAPRKAGCDWKHRGATITSSGDLLYCAVESKVLGNIVTDDSSQVFFDGEPHLRDIISSKCSNCTHDYVGLPPRKQIMRQYAARALGLKGPLGTMSRLLYSKGMRGPAFRRMRFARRIRQLQNETKSASSLTSARASTPGFPRILICGWYGTETLGDKAILGGILTALHSAYSNPSITLVSLHSYITEATRRQMPELKGIRIVSPRDGARLLAEVELLVFGGGPLMAIDELAEMEVLFRRASQLAIPRLIAGCGVGPLGESWHNESLARILSMSTGRIFRDQKSQVVANSLGVPMEGRTLVAEDPAFTWLDAQRALLLHIVPPNDKKVLILGLREFPHMQYARHLSETECRAAKTRYENSVIAALEALVKKHSDLVIRPLPMCTNHFGDDDRWFYRRLFRGNSTLAPHLDLSLLGRELSPIEYCVAFRSSHVALTMRFHSLVFALGLDVPALAIDYTLGAGKLSALAERFKVPHLPLDAVTATFISSEVERLLARPVPAGRGFVPIFSSLLLECLPLRSVDLSNARDKVRV